MAFGLRLNGGAVCMSPRRLFADEATLTALRPLLESGLAKLPAVRLNENVALRLKELLADAMSAGARSSCRQLQPEQQLPLLVDRAEGSMEITRTDMFAPVLSSELQHPPCGMCQSCTQHPPLG